MTDTRFYISHNALQLALNPDNSVPDEVQLLPYGKIKGRDGRKFAMFDIAAVISNTLKWYNPASGSDKLDLVIDYEHQTLFADKNGAPAPAAAWIKQLINKGSDGLWGKVEWTDRAKKQIAEREYRYLSPVFRHDEKGNVLALTCAGLTNYPNLELQAFNKSNLNNQEDKQVDLLAKLIQLLGLPESASEQDVIDAVTQLKSAGGQASLNKIAGLLATAADEQSIITAINKQKLESIDAAQYAALNQQITALKEQVAANKAESAVSQAIADGKLIPALKDNALAIHKSLGEAAFNDFVAKMPQLALNKSDAPTGTPPASEGSLTGVELAVCKALGISQEDYKKTLKQEKEDAAV